MSIELMGGDTVDLADERRKRQLQNLAKAREARKANAAAARTRADLGLRIEEPKKPKKLKGKRGLSQAMAEKRKPKEEPSDQLIGLNSINCGSHCTADKCVITGENVCGHPNKGGLQAKYMQDKAVLGRFGNARLALARQEAEAGKGRKF